VPNAVPTAKKSPRQKNVSPATNFAVASKELITIRDWVRFAVSEFNANKLFFGHGSASAFDEAVYLILHTLHLPLDELEPFLDAKLTAKECNTIANVLSRRVHERVPAAYLTNEAWLGEYKFYVDECVIVPRSFIAELLREDLAPWVSAPDEVTRVLDVCTGSGCLAILAALTFPNATVDAVDLSKDALQVAKRNVADYGLEDRVRLIASDMLASLTRQDQYDIILSNPPYVTAKSMAKLPDEYRREPKMALASGVDGLDHTRTLLRDAPKHLTKAGLMFVEVGFNRVGTESAFPQMPFMWPETSGGDEVVFMVDQAALKQAGKVKQKD
jgi:ribosomal protein L3 glutamine methyltransferase